MRARSFFDPITQRQIRLSVRMRKLHPVRQRALRLIKARVHCRWKVKVVGVGRFAHHHVVVGVHVVEVEVAADAGRGLGQPVVNDRFGNCLLYTSPSPRD